MAKYVCNGALLSCTMSAIPTPTPLTVLPDKRIFLEDQPMANNLDYEPFINIPTFGECCSPDNEGVQAALGSPVPCVPVVTSPWDFPKADVFLDFYPALLDCCTCMCTMGMGIISIDDPGQTTTKEG